MGKTAGQHLLHARIIIWSLYGLDLEFTVITTLRLSLFIDDHRTDGLKAADIGNVVCLHAHRPVDADQILDLMYRSDRPALLAFDPFTVLPQYDRRIFPRHLDQLFLRSLLRNPQVNLLSALLTQPCLHKLMIFDVRLQHQLLRHKRRPGIILLHKAVQDHGFAILKRHTQEKVFPANHFSAPDEEYLHDCVGICYRIVRIVDRECNHILILSVLIRDLLALGYLVDASNQIPVLDRFFKFHLLRCLIHLLFEHPDDRRMVSCEKIDCLRDGFPILLLREAALTRCIALPNVVIQARALLADVARKRLAAAADLIELLDQVDRILDCPRTRVRAKIAGLILLHCARKKHPRVFLSERHLDERVGLVILQHRIVFRTVLLDQVAFQHERFQLRIRHNIFKAPDPLDHL